MHSGRTDQAPGFYRLRVGAAVITTLDDGYLASSFDDVRGFPVDTCRDLLSDAFLPPDPRCSLNVFVIESGGKLALVDAGAGPFLSPTAGRLQQNMRMAGYEVGDIDFVLLTHMHGDHVSGLLDENGKPTFPRAEVLVSEAEAAFWRGLDDTSEGVATDVDRIPARQVFSTYGSRIRAFSEGKLFQGVSAVPLPGHTPGHTGFRVESGEDSLLIWGDIIHWPAVQFRYPEAAFTYDVSVSDAVKTRRRILAQAAAERFLVAGMHLPFPAFGHVRAGESAYEFLPVIWVHEP